MVLSGLVLSIACFYLASGYYSWSTHYIGAYRITISFFHLFDFIVTMISDLQTVALLLWIAFCALLIFTSRKYWWVNLICLVLTVPILFVGTVFGWLPLKNVDSLTYASHNFHLNYIFDGDDGYGSYSLLQCDSLDISCQQLYISHEDFPKIDRNAHIVIDEKVHQLSVTVNSESIFSEPLE